MALTGLALVGFVLIHMAGNLQVFVGQSAINGYGKSLQDLGGLLWIARAGLIVAVIVHISAAMRLVALNKAARPVKYQVFRPKRSPFYARVMPMSGLILFAFIVFHLLHFTLGIVMHDAWALKDEAGRHDIYSMVILGFQNVGVTIAYLVAMGLLCMHLAHGVTSMFQSLGLRHPKYDGLISKLGPAFATLVFVGNCSMPIAVVTGLIKLPGA